MEMAERLMLMDLIVELNRELENLRVRLDLMKSKQEDTEKKLESLWAENLKLKKELKTLRNSGYLVP